ncbi:hypothetical protein P43SY_003448 [Pythium insidiosum]|uniref:Uncharacterized protein n=1 Tax=Pythium insidiosum TaxID=114742 RepID=A0AAD5Q6H1_PYTIN|nr:hypothetical protein P43SY_003448 [Pythium insidiosum]
MGAGYSRSLFDDPKPVTRELPNSRTKHHGPVHVNATPSPYKPHMTLYTNLMDRRREPVGVFAKNRYEWVLVEHGCNRMAYQLVPLCA